MIPSLSHPDTTGVPPIRHKDIEFLPGLKGQEEKVSLELGERQARRHTDLSAPPGGRVNQQTASVTQPSGLPAYREPTLRASGMCEPVSKHTHSEELNYVNLQSTHHTASKIIPTRAYHSLMTSPPFRCKQQS